MKTPKVSIVIPAWNQEEIIEETIHTCLSQRYKDREILIIDDCSTDETHATCLYYAKTCADVRLIKNESNIGITKMFNKLIEEAQGEYIVFMCGDDVFTDRMVLGDIVDVLDNNPNVGVVDRSYYQYMQKDKLKRPCHTVREKSVLISAVNPSGIGLRKSATKKFQKTIYSEVSYMISAMLYDGWQWKRLDYDTVAVRLHKDNLAKQAWYYVGSVFDSWYKLEGTNRVFWDFKSNYISFKNRVGLWYLLKEIRTNIAYEPRILLHPLFYFFATLAILTPRFFLRYLSDWYRLYLSPMWSREKKRTYGSHRINIGCGKNQRIDATNIDVMNYDGVDIPMDIGKFPWEFKSNSVDGIYASHLIEHFPDQIKFIYECLRILKQGGFLRLNLPHSSSASAIGCFGHYRTYSYNACDEYMTKDFYIFKKARFKTVEQKLNWWYEVIDSQNFIPKYMLLFIIPFNAIVNSFISLSPRVFENLWCYYVGGAKEVVWRGEKL